MQRISIRLAVPLKTISVRHSQLSETMRLSTAVAAAAYLGLFAVDAFVAPAPFRPSGIARSMSDDRGWDNDNFLDALGGGDDAIDEANAKYDHEADVRRDRMGQASERDGNPNGDILKKMLGDRKPLKERVQPARSVPPPPPPPPPLPQMQAPPQLFDKDGNPVAVAPPQTPTYYDQNGNPVQPPPQFYYDQNGNPIPSYAPPPQGYAPPPPVPQQTNQPKRNPDADRIINKADVYLAQLKVDSTTRVMARARGDIDASNEVFTNPKINQLEEEVLKNPYLDE